MIEDLMKVVKRGNKKRRRNITVGAVVGFLLSCTVMVKADDYLGIKEENGIKFSIDTTSGTDGEWKDGNPYSENTWNETDYINNITLSGTNNISSTIGYGLSLSGDLNDLNFINNASITGTGKSNGWGIFNVSNGIGILTNSGLISGTGASGGYGIANGGSSIESLTNSGLISGIGTKNNSSGYGIYNDSSSSIGTLTNSGLVSAIGTGIGSGSNHDSGSGIFNNSSSIENLTNSGSITGTGYYKSYGISNNNSSSIRNLTNSGLISTTGYNGSGISNADNSRIETLINSGSITGIGNGSGHSYGISNNSSSIESVTNSGSITGTDIASGSGISNNSSSIESVTNSGLILGIGDSIFGYGISNNKSSIESLTNRGLISGTRYTGYGISNADSRIETLTNSGSITGIGNGSGHSYGISNNNSSRIENLINTGVIFGTMNAIKNDGGNINPANNYGLLATKGNSVVDGGITITNYGLYINDIDGKVSIDNNKQSTDPIEITTGHDESGNEIKRAMTIQNAVIQGGSGIGTSTDSFVISGGTNEFDNSILNGKNNTLNVSGSGEIKGSIINAYKTAVKFDTAGGELRLSGTIVNGGADGASETIIGSSNKNILILQSGDIAYSNGTIGTQNTIINGKIDMGDGADTLIVGEGTIINGKINMGTGDDILTIETGSILNGTLDGGADNNDTLNFNSTGTRTSTGGEINIHHNISGFESMNINTNITLFETIVDSSGNSTGLKVTDAENITIYENGVLTLRIDSTKIDSSSGTDKIVGHALYGNTGTIKSENGGKLLLALNGAGMTTIISFGNLDLDGSLVTEYEGEYQEDVTFTTTSELHSVKRTSRPKEVEVTAKNNLPTKATAPDDLAYEKLNKIYHSILSVDELGNFNVDNDEKLSTFLGYLNDIYAGNPYSYSSELSRKSMRMFRDIVTENIFKPETNKWMIYGGLTHIDGGTKDTYYGKGYYTYDVGSSDKESDTKITGAYMLGEYGISDTLTSGVVVGGNKLKSDLSNGSKVDGSAMYIGGYVKKYVGNLKVTAGAGLQYGDYDTDRLAVNRVASSAAESVMKYSDNYNDISYDIYLNGKYSNLIGDNLFLEPYGTLSYTYIKQDGADEGNKTLAIETDSKSFDYTSAKVGIDIKKVIPHEKGKSTLSAGVSYTKIINGADEEHITGRFKGGKDFDILVAHKNEHSIGLNAKYALELENGILFDIKGSYAVERDSNNNSGKNKTKGEWIVGAGLGYKF